MFGGQQHDGGQGMMGWGPRPHMMMYGKYIKLLRYLHKCKASLFLTQMNSDVRNTPKLLQCKYEIL